MYIKTICIAGSTIEISKTFSKRYGKKIPRGTNKNATPEDVSKINEIMAETKLRRLINTNFQYKDIFLTLTYRKNERPSPAQAKKHRKDFIAQLRKAYRKQGNELKYIAVTEYGTEENPKAIHHHLVINSIDIGIISDLWKFGRPHIVPLDATGDYSALASYLIKETRLAFGAKRPPKCKTLYTQPQP